MAIGARWDRVCVLTRRFLARLERSTGRYRNTSFRGRSQFRLEHAAVLVRRDVRGTFATSVRWFVWGRSSCRAGEYCWSRPRSWGRSPQYFQSIEDIARITLRRASSFVSKQAGAGYKHLPSTGQYFFGTTGIAIYLRLHDPRSGRRLRCYSRFLICNEVAQTVTEKLFRSSAKPFYIIDLSSRVPNADAVFA